MSVDLTLLKCHVIMCYHKHAYKCLKDNIHISFSADKL